MTYDYAIIGGGIVGLATAWALAERHPGARLVVLEKEADWGTHQTGHNSGVIHSGIYYAPGSLKATLAREGNRSMAAFCREHGIAHEICGKVIVATEPAETERLERLYRRGQENGLEVARLTPDAVRAIEPHVTRCVGGLRVPSTGIVDYRAVCRRLAEIVAQRGGDLRLGARVVGVIHADAAERQVVVETATGEPAVQARFLVNCAGLHSDRIARLAGASPPAQIVPFRGEYFELRPERRHLVRHLIYPVPDPDFPFLGVHFTRMIDGSVHAGPNAVLGLKREGYRKTDLDLRDLAEVLRFPGFWRLASRHARQGAGEIVRSHSRAAFVRSLRRLIPEVGPDDLVPTHAGVRAQALRPDGRLVDDFLLVTGSRALHVCNAPSPAATASLEIGRTIAKQVPEPADL